MREIPGTRERSLCVSGRGGDQEVPLSEPQCGRTWHQVESTRLKLFSFRGFHTSLSFLFCPMGMVIPSWGFLLKVECKSVSKASSVWHRESIQKNMCFPVVPTSPNPNTPLHSSATSAWGFIQGSGCTSVPPLGVLHSPGRTCLPTHLLGNSCTFGASNRKGWDNREIVDLGLWFS